MTWSHRFLVAAFLLGAPPVAPARGVTLEPGQFVIVSPRPTGGPWTVFRVTPPALDTAAISTAGLLASPSGAAVDFTGRILVADRAAGIVAVDAGSGAQSLLASSADLGGAPQGICVSPDGGLFVTIETTSSVLRLSPDGQVRTTVTAGGNLLLPAGLALGPDGALYVAERALPPSPAPLEPFGSIVRVDPRTGQQVLFSTDTLLFAPFQIAFPGDGWLWSAQRGVIAGRHGCFVRTRLSDGYSEQVATGYCRAQGLAFDPSGRALLADCRTIGPDCYYPYITSYPGDARLEGLTGPIAAVPMLPTPVTRTSWGKLKTLYR